MAKWPLVGYDGATQLNGVNTRFAAFGGDYQSNATEAETKQQVFDTYTASNLRLYLSSWVGGAGADDMIARLRTNGADDTMNLTINATGEHEDTSNTDGLVTGDEINAEFDHSAGGHSDEYTVETFQITLDASSDVPPIMASSTWNKTAGQVEYAAIQGALSNRTTATDVDYTMRATRTIRDLRVFCTAHTTTNSINISKNTGGSGATLTVSISGTGEFLDTTNTDSFVAGDEVSYFAVFNGVYTISVLSVEADTSSGVQMYADLAVGTGQQFFAPSGSTTLGASSQSTRVEAEEAATIQNLFVNCVTNAETRSIESRKNFDAGNLTVSVTGTGIFEDTANSDSLVADDVLSVRQVAGSSGSNGYLVAVEWETSVGGATFERTITPVAVNLAEREIVRTVGSVAVNLVEQDITRTVTPTAINLALQNITRTIGSVAVNLLQAVERVAPAAVNLVTSLTRTISSVAINLLGAAERVVPTTVNLRQLAVTRTIGSVAVNLVQSFDRIVTPVAVNLLGAVERIVPTTVNLKLFAVTRTITSVAVNLVVPNITRTISTVAVNLVSGGTQIVPATINLLQVVTRTVSSAVNLRQVVNRTVTPVAVNLTETFERVVTSAVNLLGAAERVIPTTVNLRQLAVTRVVSSVVVNLKQILERAVPTTVNLKQVLERVVNPVTVNLRKLGIVRTVASVAVNLLRSNERTVTPAVNLQGIEDRVVTPVALNLEGVADRIVTPVAVNLEAVVSLDVTTDASITLAGLQINVTTSASIVVLSQLQGPMLEAIDAPDMALDSIDAPDAILESVDALDVALDAIDAPDATLDAIDAADVALEALDG